MTPNPLKTERLEEAVARVVVDRSTLIEFDAWLSMRGEFGEVLTVFRDAFKTDTRDADHPSCALDPYAPQHSGDDQQVERRGLRAALWALEIEIQHYVATPEGFCPNYGEATESCHCRVCRTQTLITEWEDVPLLNLGSDTQFLPDDPAPQHSVGQLREEKGYAEALEESKANAERLLSKKIEENLSARKQWEEELLSDEAIEAAYQAIPGEARTVHRRVLEAALATTQEEK